MVSEQEDPVLHDLSFSEHDFFGAHFFTESAADQHTDRFDARNERWESDKALEDLMSQSLALP
jgi:hypothetical protein